MILHSRYLAGARKTLCLNHVLGILLDVQSSGDWKTALQSHIPKRFFDPEVNERPTGHKMLIKNRERLKMLTDVIVTDGN